jgi:hypothetical protein
VTVTRKGAGRWKPAIMAMALLAATGAAHAAPNSAKRLKAFAQLPDWSGIWFSDSIEEDAGGSLNVGRVKFFGHPPYNAAWEAEYQKRRAKLASQEFKQCVVDFPASMESPQPFNLIVTPEETVYTAGDGTFRHIFTDGRSHPPKDGLFPSITGDSIGRWEGETLVVDTVARRPGPLMFLGSAAFSEAAHFHERIRMTDKNTMEDQLTIDDPVAFTHPWVLNLGYKRVTVIDHIDPYYCDVDDRIDIVDGKMVIKPTDPAKP